MDKRVDLIEQMYDRIGYIVPMDIESYDTVDIDRDVLEYLKFTESEIDTILDNPKYEDTGIDQVLGTVRFFDLTVAKLEEDEDEDDDWDDEEDTVTIGELTSIEGEVLIC